MSVPLTLQDERRLSKQVRSYAFAPLAPQIWGEPDLHPQGWGAKRWYLRKSGSLLISRYSCLIEYDLELRHGHPLA